jgi:aminopeptidase N
MADRRFKYQREDFGDLPARLHHLTIKLDFFEDRVEAENCLEMTANTELDSLSLDARELEILRVESVTGAQDQHGTPLPHQYHREHNKLVVELPRRHHDGERFLLRTLTRCVPSDHVLEGIYKDATPPGAPQQFMSQCQQWGFQRIMPILDDCRAKCTMATTLEADARYTHLISNGNVNRRTNPDGRPVPKPGHPERQLITFENPVPMAPYLFIACAGTWDEYADEVAYPSGRRIRLEYLVPPGRAADARIPMEILKEAILWIERSQDYEYPGDTYRTICMNKSNFGGMENVGNTTIVTDAALIDEHTMDMSLLYAHGVIVHEFEHNQCGSETTMETPFDVWLNEAYTVDVERQFLADLFDPTFVRLRQVDSIRDPLLGPLTIEDAGNRGRIVREGFNDPDELIDAVTYVKAAEVIRMLRLVVGPERFTDGKRLYFSRYRHANANTDQFFQCFEEVSGISLEAFKRQWLYTLGYPRVRAETVYEPEAGRFRIVFRQDPPEGVDPFHIPIHVALVDQEGRDTAGAVFQLSEPHAELCFQGVGQPPAFVSMNRDYSFYGTFCHENATVEECTRQARLDPNAFNRIEAMRLLTDRERLKLILDPEAEIDQGWVQLYGELLNDPGLPPALKAYFLRIDEQPLERRYTTWYHELVAARDQLLAAVNGAYRPQLLEQFEALDTYKRPRSPKDGIEERMLKAILLELIAFDDSSARHRLILDHYRAATTANDRVSALIALNRSSAPERLPVLEEVYEGWHRHLSGYANYLRVVSNGTCDDVFAMIEREERRPTFDVTQPTWSRALFLPMAANTRMLWTDRGISWLGEKVIQLAPINATTASRMLNAFQHVRRLKPPLPDKVTAVLEEVVARVDDATSPTIHRQARSYLEGGH